MTAPIRVLIADDHPVFRRGLKALLELEAGLEVVAEAHHGHEALRLAREIRPDVMLLDLAMPHRNGLEVLQTVKHHMTSIFDKLGVSSRLELALFASNWKLVDPA